MSRNDTHDAGLILFLAEISRHKIAEFMHELKAANYEYDWIDLHMRDAGGETLVAYRVDLKILKPGIHTRFHHKVRGLLEKHFGQDEDKTPTGVKFWSMANLLESVT